MEVFDLRKQSMHTLLLPQVRPFQERLERQMTEYCTWLIKLIMKECSVISFVGRDRIRAHCQRPQPADAIILPVGAALQIYNIHRQIE